MRRRKVLLAFRPSRWREALCAELEDRTELKVIDNDSNDLAITVAAVAHRADVVVAPIELGPGVLIPSLRHVMVTASAIASLVERVPGRVNVGIGSGFTGRLAMGQRPNSWAFVAQYARQLRGLLAGDTVDALSVICHRDNAFEQGKKLVAALRKTIPRQQFDVPVQAAVGSRILSKRLSEAGIRHTYEEFDDNHSDVDYRMDVSLPFLYRALK